MRDELRDAVGLGVAGNMTGHLEQAGEASDFVGVQAAPTAPKGIFPFYVPGAEGFLGTFPLSSTRVRLPAEAAQVQIEPEVALVCALQWADDRVTRVSPVALAAYDDCSIRRPASKISVKKNWGPDSKGLSAQQVPVRDLADFDRWRLASFLVRQGTVHPYGVDSAVGSYSFYHDRLLDWLVDRMNHQRDQGPLEDVHALLVAAGRPRRAVVSIGATRYTPFGETTFLAPGDEAVVVVYDGEAHTSEAVLAAVRAGTTLARASLLRRAVG